MSRALRQGIVSETDRSVLVSHTGKRNLLTDEQVSLEQSLVASATVKMARCLLHDLRKLVLQTVMRLEIVRRIAQHDFVCRVDGHSVFRKREILRCQPEVERVAAPSAPGSIPER